MKKSLLLTLTACIAMSVLVSCGDSGYKKVGTKFLKAAFENSTSTAKDLTYGDRDDKEIIIESVKLIKKELRGVSDFKYRYGNTYDVWGGEKGATSFYSFGDNDEYLIALDFTKDDDKGWLVDGINVEEIEDLVDEYESMKKRLAQYIDEGDKEKIETKKTEVKNYEELLNSIKDILSDDLLKQFKKIKSSK